MYNSSNEFNDNRFFLSEDMLIKLDEFHTQDELTQLLTNTPDVIGFVQDTNDANETLIVQPSKNQSSNYLLNASTFTNGSNRLQDTPSVFQTADYAELIQNSDQDSHVSHEMNPNLIDGVTENLREQFQDLSLENPFNIFFNETQLSGGSSTSNPTSLCLPPTFIYNPNASEASSSENNYVVYSTSQMMSRAAALSNESSTTTATNHSNASDRLTGLNFTINASPSTTFTPSNAVSPSTMLNFSNTTSPSMEFTSSTTASPSMNSDSSTGGCLITSNSSNIAPFSSTYIPSTTVNFNPAFNQASAPNFQLTYPSAMASSSNIFHPSTMTGSSIPLNLSTAAENFYSSLPSNIAASSSSFYPPSSASFYPPSLARFSISSMSSTSSANSRSSNDNSRYYSPAPYQKDYRQRKSAARGGQVYVKVACTSCKKSHIACDVYRPCSRCIRLEKAETCEDSVPKKRGRPKKHRSASDNKHYHDGEKDDPDDDCCY